MEGNQKEVRTSQKLLHTLRVGTPGISNVVLCGCKLMTLTFPDNASIELTSLSFTNRYTGTIIITAKCKISQPASSEEGSKSYKFEWKKIVSKKLMPYPHYATGAESKFVLNKSDFLCEPAGIVALKFTLHQPSVQFTEFGIENLCIYKADTLKPPSDALTKWLNQQQESVSSKHNSIKDMPSLDKISQVLQKMWALGKKAADLDHQGVDPNRFDKDGCYDINLLAY